jgi:hypothetical protein
MMAAMVRVVLPYHLRVLAKVQGELRLELTGPVTQRAILDAIEAQFPVLAGTLRDHGSDHRRPLIRFFACEEDVSNASPDDPLPAAIAEGREPYLIVGAIAGG